MKTVKGDLGEGREGGEEGRRVRGYGLRVGIQILVVAFLVGAVNYLSFENYERWDFSRTQEFRLAMQTRQILRALRKEVKITVFFSPTQLSYQGLIARDFGNLLEEIVFSGKPKVKVEYVDPTRNFQRAQELQSKFGFGAGENVLIFEYDGRHKLVPVGDLAEFDFRPVASGEAPAVVAFRGEQVIAATLLGLLEPEKRTVYFLQGHGEPGLGKGSPISLLLDYCGRQNVRVEALSLGNPVSAVPTDAAAVFIVGARYDLNQEEQLALLNYWKKDGRVMLLLDPDVARETPHLLGLSTVAGIQVQDTRVLRTIPLKIATGIVRDVAANFIGQTDIISRLQGVRAHFPDPVQSLAAMPLLPEGIVVKPLVVAEEEYWGETEYVTDENRGVAYDDGVDVGFPVCLAFSSARGGIRDDRVEIQTSKMIVVGNTKFVYDEFIGGSKGNVANLDFLMSGLNWMLDRNKLTGMVPKVPREFKLSLTNEQLASIALYTMVLIPGGVALFGLFVWWRRRA